MASSISNALNARFRMTGLASGLDTDSIIQQMVKADRVKVDKMNQKKQVLEWQKDGYRSMINVLRDFRDTYFDLAKPSTNFRSSSAFGTFSITSGNSSILTATATTSAASKTHNITVDQLATAATRTGTTVTDPIAASGNVTLNMKGKQLNITLDGTTKTIDLDDYTSTGTSGMKSDIEAKLKAAFGAVDVVTDASTTPPTTQKQSKVIVDFTGSKIGFSVNSAMKGSTLSVAEAPNNYISSLGFSNGGKNFITSSADVTNFSGGTFKISMGGGAAVPINVTGASDIGTFADNIRAALATAGLDGQVKLTAEGNKLTFISSSGEPMTLSSGDTNNILGNLKVSSGATVSGTSSVNINLTADERGKSFTININGTDVPIEFDNTVASNNFTNIEDMKSYIQSKITAAGFASVTVDTSGDKLVFKSAIGSKITFKNGPQDTLADLGFSATDNTSNRILLGSSLDSIKTRFGVNLNVSSPTDNVSFAINGTTIDLKKDFAHATINDVMNAINSSNAGVEMKYDSLNDRFTLATRATGAAQTLSITDTSNELFKSLGLVGVGVQSEAGKDATFALDGVTGMVRSSNTFSIDGVNYTLKSTGTTTLDVKADVDGMYNKIKGFVDKYNSVVLKVTEKTSEKRYKDYTPLTAEQKESMKEADVKLWEEKAKSGMLRNDELLSNSLYNMRKTFYDPVYTNASDTSSKLSTTLSSIGITTSSYETNGALVIDEAKLKEAIKNNPDKIIELFTRESSVSYNDAINDSSKRAQRYNESGIAQRLYDVLQDNIRTTRNSSGQKGLLLEKAGTTGDLTEFKNLINSDIDEIDDKIDNLNSMIYKKESFYYAKFSRLESVMSQMNSQSAWFSKQ